MPTIPPRVPTQTQQPTPMPYQRSNAPALAFGIGGQGLGNLGQGLDQFGDVLAARAKELIDQNNRVALEDAINQYHDETRPLVMGWKQLQGRDAMSLYDPQTNRINPRVEEGLNEIKGRIGDTLPERVKPLFNIGADRRQNSILDDVAGHVVTERVKSIRDVVDASKKLLDDDLQDVATQVEVGTLSLSAARDKAGAAIADIRQRGVIDDATAALAAKSAGDYIDQAATRAWFKRQPDRVSALDALYRGKVPVEIGESWARLGAAQRDALFSKMADESGRILAAQNQAREMGERNARLSADRDLNRAIFSPDATPEQRVAAYNTYSRSAYADSSKLRALDDLIRGGGREEGQTDARAALALEGAIRRGEVQTEDDLAEWIGHGVSLDQIRSHYMPLLDAKRNGRFKSALDWATSEVGGSSQGMFTFPGDSTVANRISRVEAALLDYQQRNPNGDPWEEARRIVPAIKGQAKQEVQDRLPVLVQDYRNALESGNVRTIAAARTSLIAVMQQSGMVDALEASRQGFDPLSAIEAAQGATNGR